jgi:hypothetical protein
MVLPFRALCYMVLGRAPKRLPVAPPVDNGERRLHFGGAALI